MSDPVGQDTQQGRLAAVSEVAEPTPSRVRAYLQLFRLPNVFTAMADIAMGLLVTYGDQTTPAAPVLLLLASSLIYTAGMVLNDVYDYEVDVQERPHRPLPSG